MESEQLRAENERLVAEMASMKKRVKLALKKQQAELQAKLQLAEQRALAAEALAASSGADVSGGDETGLRSKIDATQIPSSLNGTLTSSPSSQVSRSGSVGELLPDALSSQPDEDSLHPQGSFGSLHSEKNAEGQNGHDQENEINEKQRLQEEIVELQRTRDATIKEAEDSRINIEEELRLVKVDAEQRVERLTKEVEKLGADLHEATGKLDETSAQMSALHEDMSRTTRENIEVKQAHLNLVSENERTSEELGQSSAALADAQRQIQEKTKEMDEMAAARRTAQEGQEAAMSELIHQLGQMDAASNGQHIEHLNKETTQSFVHEKNELMKQLDLSNATIAGLQEEIATYKRCLESAQDSQILGSSDRDHSDRSAVDSGATGDEGNLRQAETQTVEANDRGPESEDYSRDGPDASPAHLEEIANLKRSVEDHMASRVEAETQTHRLSVALNETEQQVMRLTQELARVQGNIGDGIQSRDDKYAELDAKFGRLQKRAKQRIQEVQKEKEEVEVQLTTASEKAAQALSKQAALSDDLDRARFQAGEALRTLDAERQQLRVANIKLRDEVEDLRRTLDGKEHNLAESRLLASEKDQNVFEISAKLNEADAEHASALSDFKEKMVKAEENFKAQAADAAAENEKMVETITALQAQLGNKESKLAELDAASGGEMVRLGAALEAAKGEASRLQVEHRQEQDAWQAALDKLKRKVEDAEKAAEVREIAVAKEKSSFEAELGRQRQLLGIAEADSLTFKNETAQVTRELAAYKVRAYALLQKKEAELLAAKDSDLAAAQEIALKSAQREAAAASRERDKVLKALNDTESEYENKLATRDMSVLDAEQRIRDLAAKVEASRGQLLVEQEHWNNRLEQVEATWRSKCNDLQAHVKSDTDNLLEKEFTTLMADYSSLKAEFATFRDLVDNMVEEKDREVARLLEENTILQRSISPQQIRNEEIAVPEKESPEVDFAPVQIAEQQILHLARQQAQREEEVSQCQRHIQALQDEVLDLERENRLHRQQETLLKEEFRNLERAHKRDGVDMTYLKNVILKLLQTGEVEALLPVVAMLLQFSPHELKLCQETYSNNAAANSAPLSGSTPSAVDHPGTPRTFLSRLTFTTGS